MTEHVETELEKQYRVNQILILEKIEYIEDTVAKLKKSLEDRTNDISDLIEHFKRVQKIAEDAKKLSTEIAQNQTSVYESVKTHIASIDRRIIDFDNVFKKQNEENKIQNQNINEKIDLMNENFAVNYENFNTKIDALIESDSQRTQKEVTEKALKDAEEKRLDVFWKRLPIWISFAVVIAGFTVWLINAIIVTTGKK